MAKSRIVVRRYYSKKAGRMVTKTYTYAHKSKKGLVLVDKRGRAVTKNIERFKQSILSNTNYNEAEKRGLLADLNATIKQRKHDARKLTTSGFMGKQERDATTRFFANAGYSVEEFADELDVDVEDILNNENGEDGVLSIGNRHFKFNWTYTGQFYEEY